MIKIKTVFFIAVLSMSLATIQLGEASRAVDKVSQKNKEIVDPELQRSAKEKELNLKKISKSSIKLINDIVLGDDLSNAKKKNELGDKNLKALDKILAKSQQKSSFLKKIGKSYKALKSEVNVQEFSIENGLVRIIAEEITEVTESDVEPTQNFVPKYSKLHEFTFDIVKNNKIELMSHRILDDPAYFTKEQLEFLEPVPPGAVPAIVDIDGVDISESSNNSTAPSDHRKARSYAPSLFNSTSSLIASNDILIAQAYGPLNRQGMVRYAETWWNSFNPKYRDYTSVGGDCTNYASQILHEGGGLRYVNSNLIHYAKNTWWYNHNYYGPTVGPKRQSNSWSNAVAFYDFMAAMPEIVKPVNRTSLLNVGDIVQVDFGAGLMSHTMIVTSKRTSDSMIYLTGHSNPRLYMPVYDLITDPDVKLYTWKLTI